MTQDSRHTCSCPPNACHGGHTIDVGPSWVCVPDDRLRQFRDDPDLWDDTTRSMAAELLALRARIAKSETLGIELLAAHRRIAELEKAVSNV